ncbi:MAG TPA: tripartite tricarboxylate transporter substrate-binding protein [Bradyrhizobium sp.]|nr:tripartite tricarboxylate transporter substrate-binding protein [Bradyrhizobium sp.]
MKRAAVFLALALGLALTGGAAAQSYPSRPITLIIPGAPGGPGDMVGRVLIERMRTSLGQPLVMENVAGANGTIASARLARAAPDGYTLLLGNWNSQVGASAVYPVPYDVLADLEPIALATFSRLWLVGRGALPPDNIAELIAWLKANPGKATVATVGQGSASHVCGIYFQNATKTEFQFVFYRAGSPAYQDLVAGHIDLMCAERSATVEHLRAGRIKAYGLLAEKRWSAAPDVPTMEESGVPGAHIPWLQGFWAPKGTPRDIVARLNAAVAEALADPAVHRRLTEFGLDVAQDDQRTPEALRALQKAETEKWWPLIKAAGARPE